MKPPRPVDEWVIQLARQVWDLARRPPEEVLLVGSRARGTERPDSDVDLMIVMHADTTREDVGALSQDIVKIEAASGIRIEPFYPTGAELRDQLERHHRLPSCAMKDAILLLPEGNISPYIEFAAEIRRRDGEPRCPSDHTS